MLQRNQRIAYPIIAAVLFLLFLTADFPIFHPAKAQIIEKKLSNGKGQTNRIN
jgi:hypothetical protein